MRLWGNYDGTENMMMSITNIEGSLQDSEHKDLIEVMMSVIHEIQNRERERYIPWRWQYTKNSKHD